MTTNYNLACAEYFKFGRFFVGESDAVAMINTLYNFSANPLGFVCRIWATKSEGFNKLNRQVTREDMERGLLTRCPAFSTRAKDAKFCIPPTTLFMTSSFAEADLQ